MSYLNHRCVSLEGCARTAAGLLLAICGLAIGPSACSPGYMQRGEMPFEEAGPPPPGHPKIIGEPMPGWKEQRDRPRACEITWTFIGPKPISGDQFSAGADCSGRVVSIAPHPTDADIVYIATASGGIWKTTDGGDDWNPLTDDLSILNHGAIAIDPSNPNVLYMGTGEYTQKTASDGIFKSINSGQTWNQIATADDSGPCSGIAVNPENSDIVWTTGRGGCYLTEDAGLTWDLALAGDASCVELNLDDPDIVYVGLVGQGLAISLDGGDSWAIEDFGLDTDDIQRIVMDSSLSHPDIAYAAVINAQESLEGLYRTGDAGDTWDIVGATPDFPKPQGLYDAYVAIDPGDPDVVYCGGVDNYAVHGIAKTDDGGATWVEAADGLDGSHLHPDHHAMAFGPDGTIWEANDGGIWKSETNGLTWESCNQTLAVTQIYQLALSDADADTLSGGTQDNGTAERANAAFDWPELLGGDGGFGAYDFVNQTQYLTAVALDETSGKPYPLVFRRAEEIEDITGDWDGQNSNFISPVVRATDDPAVVFVGTDRVWMTLDATDDPPDWEEVSDTFVSGGGVLNCIAVFEGDWKHVYTGSSTGKVYYSAFSSDDESWGDVSAGLPAGDISDILIDPFDPELAYVSFHNTTGGRIFKTDDAGDNWEDLTGTLPDGVGVHALAVDFSVARRGMFVGSGAGIYYSKDDGQTWEKNCDDLPNVNIGDLRIDAGYQFIIAGTYGRGAWRAWLPSSGDCPDIDGSGFIDTDDFDTFVYYFELGHPAADFDNSGFVDFVDYSAFVDAFILGSGC